MYSKHSHHMVITVWLPSEQVVNSLKLITLLPIRVKENKANGSSRLFGNLANNLNLNVKRIAFNYRQYITSHMHVMAYAIYPGYILLAIQIYFMLDIGITFTFD
ncbi:uncharacterized protein EV154DRAFT_553582 [Mucor mucedo]|uniref:uncharacterized protein n=1 Tax=Mucor mucedo TaxID=29922 RepID=UPI00221F107E|nr:uncharacterized protein EV154DRAFT_553582 [Mucor mucedo]KAI7888729.1 hypothetical protein EV154DRAFT_553582 [Mucor mucedo]